MANVIDLPPLDLASLGSQWQLRPGVAVAVAVAGIAYAAGVRRARRSGGWPLRRTLSFAAGLAVIVVATCSGIELYGRVLEWVHMIEHLLLIMVAPVLLAVGSPAQLVADAVNPGKAAGWRAFLARPAVTWLTSPVSAAVLYAIAVVGVHLTGIMDAAMRDRSTHLMEELTYLGTGFLLFQLVFGVNPGRWQLSGAGRLGLLAAVTPVDAVVGFVLLQTGTVLGGTAPGPTHSSHDAVTPRPEWAGPAATDTIAAGTTMWIGGTGIMVGLMIAVALAWLHGRPATRSSPSWTDQARQATFASHTGLDDAQVDSEEARAAYNAWLARLADKP